MSKAVVMITAAQNLQNDDCEEVTTKSKDKSGNSKGAEDPLKRALRTQMAL